MFIKPYQTELRLDQPDKMYRPGDTISGEIAVTSTKELEIDRVDIQLGWQTHGKGTDESRHIRTNNVSRATNWYPGMTQTYRFSFVVPQNMPTYHGHHIKFQWNILLLVQRDRIKWLKGSGTEEMKHSVDFYSAAPPKINNLLITSEEPLVKNAFKYVGIAVLAIVCLCFFLLLDRLPFMLLAFAIGILFPLFQWLAKGVRGGLLGVAFEQFSVQFPNRWDQPSPLPMTIELVTVKKTLAIHDVTAEFHVYEKAILRDSSGDTTHKHTVLRHTEKVAVSEKITAGVPFSYTLAFDFTETVPPPFDLNNNSLVWEVTVDLRTSQGQLGKRFTLDGNTLFDAGHVRKKQSISAEQNTDADENDDFWL